MERVIKLPYYVPLMREIRRVKPNGLTVVSTFAGAGGSSLGYRMAGFSVLWVNEFVEAAREVYRLNCEAGTIVDGRDIRDVKAEDILEATKLEAGDLDVLDGSPPCASFSTAGKREKSWGKVATYSDTKQRSDDLFFEFVRIRDGLMPKVFVAENVSGLVKGKAKGYFFEILAALKRGDYSVRARMLDAQWLGVPQVRQRVFFIGVRRDLGIEPTFPDPLPHRYALKDAVPWLRGVGIKGGVKQASEPAPTVLTHGRRGTESEFTAIDGDISPYAIGKEWDKLRPGQESRKYFQLQRNHPDRPTGTVTAEGGNASIASITHPFERRKFSIEELRRICGFPDDFKLAGTYAQQWERLGRAVPPPMMKAIAERLRDGVLLPAKSGRPEPGSSDRSTKGSRRKDGEGTRNGARRDRTSGPAEGKSRKPSPSRSRRGSGKRRTEALA
jgi:DNA (cytosine-5)-methyltransferase 1